MAIDVSGFYMVPEHDSYFMIHFFPIGELLDLSLEDWDGSSHIYAQYSQGLIGLIQPYTVYLACFTKYSIIYY